MPGQADQEVLRNGVNAFVRWLESEGYESYDPYDIWGTRYGLMSRRIYYRAPLLGAFLVAPLLLMEMICPELRRLMVKKQRFATAEAQLVLGFLNLYQLTSDLLHLRRAMDICDGLLQLSLAGYSGHCWGYPFDWQNAAGLWPKNTPFITATPYCYEAFVSLGEITGEERYLSIARSVAKFVQDDLNDTPIAAEAAAASYSPHVHDQVVNASAYRAFVLFDAAHRFGETGFLTKANKNLQFILDAQHPDGSWPYALNEGKGSFIDHFHTCFVLKNLFKINQRLHRDKVRETIGRGYSYYLSKLFYANGMPKYFAVAPRMETVRMESYNLAEAITLGVLFRHDVPSAYDATRRLASTVCRDFQLPAGYFITRVYIGGRRHKQPFIRWPQAQMFYALTSLLLAEANTHGQMEAQGCDLVTALPT
jgi:hypothetical protein